MRCVDDVSLAVEEVWSLVLFFLRSVFCWREVLTTSFHERSARERRDLFCVLWVYALVSKLRRFNKLLRRRYEYSASERSVRVRRGCEGERRYRTLISLLGSLSTMRRVVNYHSSWARQRQVELFDASGIRVLDHGEWLITTL
ncbi:hypothetical protein F511_40998 [Dorcoceras hygrometricum]|uniref:Uncharacterized protein n=1 Tax=Dorcoceras hygrometricum TaxID=472368 RepID=A0A2Z7BIX0_9LAMI|nr:hypothetical protein F511_40998 [Dorcoceras hygrometricum]